MKLRGVFAPYDPVDVLVGVAALSLYPHNSSRILRLEAVAEVAATQRPLRQRFEGKRRKRRDKPKTMKLTPARLRALVAKVSASFPEVVRNEDPFDGPMVEGAAIFGRDVRLLPGLAPEDIFSFRKLSSSLEDADLPDDLRPIRRLLLAVAALSSEIARRAELPPGCSPETADNPDVGFPEGKVLGRLRYAVRFRTDELAALCRSFGATLRDIEPLVQELGARSEPDFSAEDGPLASRPVIRARDFYVVAAPHCLLRAVFLHLLRDASDLQPALAERFHSACRGWLSAFGPMICEATPSRLRPISGGGGWLFTGWGVEMDVDKVLYVTLLTEAGTGAPSPENLRAMLRANLAAIEEDQQVLLVVLYQRLFLPIGLPRGAFRDIARRCLVSSLHDLETALYGGPVGPLGLWYYAGALDRFEARISITPTSTPLDLWAFYRDHKNSFYLGDDKPPDLLWISPCYASDFRCRVAQDRRRHGIRHHSEPRDVEVVSATPESRALTFIGIEEDDRANLRAVEAGVPVWVRAPSGGSADGSLADAVAFWIGELAPYVTERLAAESADYPALTIDIACNARTDEASLLQDVGDIDFLRVERDGGRIVVEVKSMVPFATATNEGERRLAGDLYRAFVGSDKRPAAEHEAADVLDAVAPLGPKKHLHISIDTHDPELDPVGLPRPKPVRGEVADEILDDLGAYLRQSGKYSVGASSPNLLNGAVSYLFDRLKDAIATLSPHGLLETLVAEHEAIIRDAAWRERTLPSQEAVARDQESFVEHVADSMPRLAETAVAGRFLVEYVASTPPTGSGSLSRTRLDELLSLASLVCNYGMLSDIEHHELVDLKPALLPSGRLGVDRQRMKAIYEIAHRRRALTGATAAERLPAPKRQDGGQLPNWWGVIQPLLRSEFGYSLDELSEATSALLQLAMRRGCASGPRAEVVAAIEEATGWPQSDVERVLRAMTLEERRSFEDSGSLEKFHVYPWRFNRELSYLRRPLIMRRRDGVQSLVWGSRNLFRSWRHLFALITEARLRARPGGDLARCISEIAQQRHERFNDDVADWFDTRGFRTRRRASKFAADKLQDDKGDLGDVDVLVVDHERRRLMAVECKGVHLALVATDIANQISELHRKLSIHRRRAEWLVEHVESVQSELGLEDGSWEIVVLAVTEEALVSQSYGDLPVPIFALAELARAPEAAWPGALVVGRVDLGSSP